MKNFIVLFFTCIAFGLFGQANADEVWTDVKPYSIPSSPAFSLLGVNPEIISRPSDIKEFKVDWRIKNYKIAPDLALEAQPLWWLYYRKKGPSAYGKMKSWERIVSTSSLSLATAKIDNVNHLSWALKWNVYKSKDPFTDNKYLKSKESELQLEIDPFEYIIDSLRFKQRKERDVDSIRFIKDKIRTLEYQIKMLKNEKMQELQEESSRFAEENWNMDMVDVAFGRVYTYDNGGLDSLRFRKAGWGLSVNGAKGVGKSGLVTGLIRINRVGVNSNFMIGASYRFGSDRYNFFGELIYNRMNNNPENGFLDEEFFSGLRDEDVGGGWYGYNEGDGYVMWTMAYGGDFRLSNNILLNFALRTQLTSKVKFSKFLPVANIICLMN